jgi:hypothetical protein
MKEERMMLMEISPGCSKQSTSVPSQSAAQPQDIKNEV